MRNFVLVAKQSAGILAYRQGSGVLEVLLVHPGGPFHAKKDLGDWSIPKGEFANEDALAAARREFMEETGQAVDGTFIALQPVKLKSGKLIYAWAVEADIDAGNIVSNTFELEWPPRSGRMQSFPEVDRAAWFTLAVAEEKINAGQAPLLRELSAILQA